MKKLIRIAALYIFTGLLIALAVSATGGFENLMIKQTMGTMSLQGYFILMALVTVLWLPAGITILLSPAGYLKAAYGKPGAATLLAVFAAGCMMIVRNKE